MGNYFFPGDARRVKVNVIAFAGSDAEDEKFLKDLAELTGGFYKYVSVADLQRP